MKKLFVFVLAFAALTTTKAAITITANQVGNDVVLSFTGSVATSGLTLVSQATYSSPGILQAQMLWASNSTVDLYSGITGPTIPSFGGYTVADTLSGDALYIRFDIIGVPRNYVSGTSISGSMTFNNKTIAQLGLNQTGTWVDGGANTIATFSVVPEPHEYAMYASLGLAGFGIFRRFRRSSSGVSV